MTTADNKRVSVPIYVSLLLIAGYIVAGALLFTLWEEDWNFFIGCYFSFITLTTIGYGDFSPSGSAMQLYTVVYAVLGIGFFVSFNARLVQVAFESRRRDEESGEGTDDD